MSGHLLVDPEARERYLEGCADVVRQARGARGCLDFALSPDLLDPGRINVLERWESQGAVEAFRCAGTPDDQAAQIVVAGVAEYDVAAVRVLA